LRLRASNRTRYDRLVMSDSEKPKVWVSAILCNDVIREANGVTTALRISNGYQANPVTLTLPDGNSTTVFRPLEFKIIITSHCELERRFDLTFRLIKTEGEAVTDLPPFNGVHVKGALGMTLTINMSLPSEKQGVFWLEVYVDGELSFKMPMIVTHQPREVLLKEMEAGLSHSAQTEQTPK